MSPRTKTARAERTRALILQSAALAFGDDGVRGATIEAIAQRAGVTKPTVYAHFSGKEELFQAVIGEAKNLVRSPNWQPYSAEQGLEQQLFSILDEYFVRMLEPEAVRLHRALTTELGLREDKISEEERPSIHRELARWLMAASKCNEICEENLLQVAELFTAMLYGTLYFPVMLGVAEAPDTRARRRKLRQALTFLRRALRPEH